MNTTTTSRINTLGVVCIPVSDQDKAIEFYVDTLGFEKRADIPFGNGFAGSRSRHPGLPRRSRSPHRRRASRPAMRRRGSSCTPATSRRCTPT
jgi:catechol 2,3-dioxygenase-like lactoylglutathione lyase family enzyme